VDGDPGNKAILPVLWSLFPHHRYLLDTDFVVNDELAKTGYAVKPISGRCGNNIDLIGLRMKCWIKPAASLSIARISTSSCGACRKWMVNTFRCAFTVGGNYGGTCLRGDSSLVVKKRAISSR
jgi:glutathionylspermidine amidase/synthetase